MELKKKISYFVQFDALRFFTSVGIKAGLGAIFFSLYYFYFEKIKDKSFLFLFISGLIAFLIGVLVRQGFKSRKI